uniref:Transmembrane protein n=1 Tax=Globodera pallida TaxID=36090 RepID=A0A183CJG1_GLOPA
MTFFPSTAQMGPTTADGMNANPFLSHKRRRGHSPPAAEPQQSFRRLEDGHIPSGGHLAHANFIAIPPTPNAPREQQQNVNVHRRREQQRHSTGGKDVGRGGEGLAVVIQQKVFENYHLVAYTLVIVTYLFAFCEYLYLRLLSLIFPDPLVYRRNCEKYHYEVVYRNELHFASGCAVFLVTSVYQLVCFFLLTVSSRFMEVKRTYSHVISIEQRLRHELVFAVQRTMFATLYPTFAIYLMCSAVILCSIFYMVGLRDQIVHVGSLVLIYLFDLFVVLYFLAFPVLGVLFHPDIDCRARLARRCCWRNRRATATDQPISVGGKSMQTIAASEEHSGVHPTSDGTGGFTTAIRNTKIVGVTDKAPRTKPPGGVFAPGGGAVRSVPAALETMAREGAEGELRKSGEEAPEGDYGGEREFGTADGDERSRLREGSDESAQCRQGTMDKAKTEAQERAAAEAFGTEQRKAQGKRWHAADSGDGEAWEDAGTVSC